jgi:hypothetical protein
MIFKYNNYYFFIRFKYNYYIFFYKNYVHDFSHDALDPTISLKSPLRPLTLYLCHIDPMTRDN